MMQPRPDDVPAAIPAGGARRDTSTTALALAVMVLGGFVLYEAATGPGNPGYATIGPGAFPALVGTALLANGVALLWHGVNGRWRIAWFEQAAHPAHPRGGGDPEREPQRDPSELLGPRLRGDERIKPLINVLLVAAALVLDVVLMAPLGFIVASATMFALVATAFGRRRLILDAAIGLAFAGSVYLVFVHALGLYLPVGWLWENLPWMS
jgi:putative tricarboxylic transport membrane protein